jgi:FixJ family two-component response regulator
MASHPAPRIFVVDDEYVIASTLAVILDMDGFSSRAFTQPGEALAAAHEDPPDLLLSEVAMPGFSGIDLAIQIKALNPSCKILLFSGRADTPNLLEDARRRGHDFRLLVKPLPPSQLLTEIGKLCDRVQPRSRRDAKAALHLLGSKRKSRIKSGLQA